MKYPIDDLLLKRPEYAGLGFKEHLKKILEESRLMLGIFKDSYNRVWTQEEKASHFLAGYYFTKKYNLHLTVGDLTNLEDDFEETYKIIWKKFKEKNI